jgi:hypothetical protein
MEQIIITCIDNGMSKEADVLSRTDKYLKVARQGTTMTVELSRTDLNRPYIGRKAGLEFSYND